MLAGTGKEAAMAGAKAAQEHAAKEKEASKKE
jgi:hypothetical protein